MCGRYNVIDDPLVQDLLEILGIPIRAQTRLKIAPGAKGQIVYETNQGRTLEDAIWSLLIEPKPDRSGYRPSPKYSTFNARSGSLGTSPLWKKRFHSQRAIIPDSGFHEWTGEKGHKQCYNIRPVNSAYRLCSSLRALGLPRQHCSIVYHHHPATTPQVQR